MVMLCPKPPTFTKNLKPPNTSEYSPKIPKPLMNVIAHDADSIEVELIFLFQFLNRKEHYLPTFQTHQP
jgi:hypothetical protein